MSGRGGRRPGSGRKAGSRAKKVCAVVAEATANNMTPLQYMIAVMCDPDADIHRRDDMAKAAAQYVHPRLASLAVSPDGAQPRRESIKVEFILPRGYGVDERGQIVEQIEHGRELIDVTPEGQIEH
jgi:hypothetical protein